METLSNTRDRDLRRLSKLKRSGLFVKDATCSRFLRATTADDILQAFSLVYDVYVEKKFLNRHKLKMRLRPYDIMPTTATFVAKHPIYSVVGTFSVIADSDDLGLPSDQSFKSELDALRGERRLVCELSNQAIHKAFRQSSISTELMRCAYAHAHHMGCTDLICSISPNLVSFYNFMEFEQISDKKSSSPGIDDPVVLMRLPKVNTRWTIDPPLNSQMHGFWREFFVATNGYLSCIATWCAIAGRMFDNKAEIAAIYGRYSDFVASKKPVSGDTSISSELSPSIRRINWQPKGALVRRGYSFHPSSIPGSLFEGPLRNHHRRRAPRRIRALRSLKYQLRVRNRNSSKKRISSFFKYKGTAFSNDRESGE